MSFEYRSVLSTVESITSPHRIRESESDPMSVKIISNNLRNFAKFWKIKFFRFVLYNQEEILDRAYDNYAYLQNLLYLKSLHSTTFLQIFAKKIL